MDNNIKPLNKHVGDLRNMNKTGYYWIKRTTGSEWTIAFYQANLKNWLHIGIDKNTEMLQPSVVNWNKIGMFEVKIPKSKAIYNTLNELEVDQTVLRDELISLLWGDDDYFIRRSFSVMFTEARKKLKNDDILAGKPERHFQTRMGNIKRIK